MTRREVSGKTPEDPGIHDTRMQVLTQMATSELTRAIDMIASEGSADVNSRLHMANYTRLVTNMAHVSIAEAIRRHGIRLMHEADPTISTTGLILNELADVIAPASSERTLQGE